jgi:uncharacterized membrane protein
MRLFALLFSLVLIGLPWAWLLGIYVADVARLLSALLILSAIALPRFRLARPSLKWIRPCLLSFAIVFPLAVFGFVIARMRLGRVGIDFTLFVQVIDSLARTGRPWTSLLGVEWQNFFSHHLDLMLWGPALFATLGLNALYAAALGHGLAIAFTLYFLWRFVSTRKDILMLFPLFCLLPTVRHSLLWSIHDDVLALPFLAASWWFWRKQRYRSLGVALALALTCKETMGLWVGCFALMAFAHDRRRTHLIFMILGFSLFFGYVFLQPVLLGKSFDHLGKIASIEQLTDPHIAWEKLWFFVNLLFPFVLLIGRERLSKLDLLLFLPAAPFLGLIAVSNFAEMWRPLNYYGLIPSLTCFLASIDIRQRSERTLDPFALALIVSLSFTTGTLRLGSQIVEAWKAAPLPVPALDQYPGHTRIAMSPSAHLILLGTGHAPVLEQPFIGRAVQWQAKGLVPDLVIFKAGEEKDLPPEFLTGKDCPSDSSNPVWTYLCPG